MTRTTLCEMQCFDMHACVPTSNVLVNTLSAVALAIAVHLAVHPVTLKLFNYTATRADLTSHAL